MIFAGASIKLHEGEESLAALAAAYPSNPFATRGYARARAQDGGRVFVLEFVSSGGAERCLAVLEGGPLIGTLEIPSMPVLPAGDFAPAIDQLVHQFRIGRLNLFSYHSAAARQPEWFPVEWRRGTDEFLWDLTRLPTVESLHKSGRQGVRLAERMGCRLVAESDRATLASHQALLASSRDRRLSRGDRTSPAPAGLRMRAFLESGVGQVFQVVEPGGAVHSSALVLRSARGAYLHSMGSSEQGFAIGAAKLLVFATAKWLHGHGTTEFNLGSAGTDGLRRFKTIFGAVGRPVEAAVYRTMGRSRGRVLAIADRALGVFGNRSRSA